jgi:3-oxoadipate enol-lactonase
MAVAQLDGVTLYYETSGEGAPVMLIAGTGSDLRQAPGPFAWPGAERFSLLAFDHRGLGRSVADSTAQPTVGDFARDALALADHVGWERFSVLGISFGGMVAQELALAAGERVERLVLAATSAGGGLGASYPLHELYSLAPWQRAARLVRLLDTRTAHDVRLRRAIERYLGEDRAFATREAASPGLLRQLEARRHHDTAARLEQLQLPTLVVAGRFDGIAPVARAAELAGAIEGARLAVFDGGHGFLLQDPAAWTAIAAFLDERIESSRAHL